MPETWLFSIVLIIFSAVIGFGFWLLQRNISKADKAREARETERESARETREASREKHQIIMIRSIGASIALGEATACALRDGHCNGEVTDALKYAKQVKHEQKSFLEEQGVKNLI